MTRARRLAVRVGVALLAVLLTAVGCSTTSSNNSTTPTSPTPPVPAPNPTPNPSPTPTLSVSCPTNATTTSNTGAAVPVTFPAPVVNGGAAPVQVICTPPSGGMFNVGTTTVLCTATDAMTTSVRCTFTVTVNPVIPRLTRTKFLAFGDSLTAGEVTVPMTSPMTGDPPSFKLVVVPATSYPSQLATMLRARYTAQTAAIEVTNSGRTGEWAVDAVMRLPGVLANLRPEVLLLLHGYNDLAALGQPGISRASQAIDAMAGEGRRRGVRVMMATLPPSRPGGKLTLPLQQVIALNDLIRATARGEGAVLVDVYAALAVDVNRYIGIDGIHPTEAGYLRMAEAFIEAIRADLEERR